MMEVIAVTLLNPPDGDTLQLIGRQFWDLPVQHTTLIMMDLSHFRSIMILLEMIGVDSAVMEKKFSLGIQLDSSNPLMQMMIFITFLRL